MVPRAATVVNSFSHRNAMPQREPAIFRPGIASGELARMRQDVARIDFTSQQRGVQSGEESAEC